MNTDIINDSISDKLIEIAKHPELRNEYQIRVNTTEIYCYKNHPMICDVDKYVYVTYYGTFILYARTEHECLEYYNKCNEIIQQMADETDAKQSLAYLNKLMANYYEKHKNLSKAKNYLMLSMRSSVFTPECVTMDEIKKLKRLVKITGDESFLDSLNSCEAYFSDFGKQLLRKKAENTRTKYYNNAIIDDVFKIIREEFDDGNEDDESSVEWLALAFLQALNIIVPPKRKPLRKGDFDYYYNKAEKGDSDAQRIIAKYYREGNKVTQNERLAEFWQTLADEHRFIE